MHRKPRRAGRIPTQVLRLFLLAVLAWLPAMGYSQPAPGSILATIAPATASRAVWAVAEDAAAASESPALFEEEAHEREDLFEPGPLADLRTDDRVPAGCAWRLLPPSRGPPRGIRYILGSTPRGPPARGV